MLEARKVWKYRFKFLLFAATKEVSVCDLRVLGNLLDRFNPKHGDCWPAIKTIAEDVGVSTRQVSRSISKLEELELIDVTRTEGRSSNYAPAWEEFDEGEEVLDGDV